MIIKKQWLQSTSNSSSFDENYSHSYWRILLIILSIFSFIILILYNQINIYDLNNLMGFKNLQSNWFYYIWYSTYAWQALWLIYGLTTILRKSSDDYFYKYPPVMHWLIYTNFLISNLLNLCCSLLANHHIYILSTFYYFLIFIALFISLALSIIQLHDYQREMYYTEKHTDIWMIRILVQNGLLIYLSWSFILLLINLNITLIFEFGISTEISAIVLLIALNLKIIFMFIIENFFLYKYLKFLFSSWLITFAFLFIFIFECTHWLFYDLTFICSIITLTNLVILFLFKVIIFLRNEIFYKKFDNSL